MQFEICRKVVSSCGDCKNWRIKGPNVARCYSDAIKNFYSNFETSDDIIIRKMLIYSNFYRAQKRAQKQNSMHSTKSNLLEPVESSAFSATQADPYFLK